MAIGVIATLKIQEGKNSEFEQTFKTLAEKALEQHQSEEGLKAHGEIDYFKEAAGRLRVCLPVHRA